MNKIKVCGVRACATALFSMVCAAASAAAPQPKDVPELLRTADGKTVATSADWERVRRPEILDFFERNVFGKRPAALGDRSRVSFRTVSSEDVFDDNAVRKIVVVRFDGPEGVFEFPLTAYIPRTTAPAPVFINILLSPRSGTVVSPDGARHSPSRWPVKDILARGYATVSYMVTDVAADEKGKGFSQGIFKAVEKESARNDESWGTLSAWAWAASKAVDWIETQDELDAKRIAIVGHSRGGKTALWAAATDTRIAMPCSNDSGCTGAKLNHIDLPRSESIKVITTNFPYWFCNNYLKFAGKDKKTPFDQHWLVALAAPRPACVGSGSQDHWAGPLGEWWSAKLASPAWKLYNLEGLAADEFPAPGCDQQEGAVSYHVREGRHALTAYDWQRYMDFADRQHWRDNVSRPASLAVDMMESPSNIGAKPVFSWRMESPRKGAKQTAYRIIVVAADGSDGMWDSGTVESSATVGIQYVGKPLESAKTYFWTVSLRDEKGAWSAPVRASFTTGLFKKEDWDGSQWISPAEAQLPTDHDKAARISAVGTACFAKTISNPAGKKIKEVYWTVAGLGVFEAFVNSKPVSRLVDGEERRDFLKPGNSEAFKTKYSFTYEVSHLFDTASGAKNTLSAQVSSGWWRDKISNYAGKKSAFRAMLTVRYDDGTVDRVPTDLTWGAATSMRTMRAGIYDGEDCDARIALPEEAAMPRAVANDEFKGELLPMAGPGISLRRDLTLEPVSAHVWKGVEGAAKNVHGKARIVRKYPGGRHRMVLDKGETLVVDFGQNASAVPEFAFTAPAGTRLVLRPAEMLNDAAGERSRGNDGPGGSAYFANYRGCKTSVVYIGAGAKNEKWIPTFTYFGYRYLSITATEKTEFSLLNSIPVTSIAKGTECGFIHTGDKDVNKLVSNILWGQYSNYLSVPTDCPQRDERLGWTADTQIFTAAALYNANVYPFLKKWMRDMRDVQDEKGGFLGVAPQGPFGSRSPLRLGWSDAGVIVPYTIWKRTGDRRIIDENWASICKFMDYANADRYASPAALGYQWADWLSFEKHEPHRGDSWQPNGKGGRRATDDTQRYWKFLGGCYCVIDATMLAEMAEATGRTEDAAKFRGMAAELLSYVRDNFLEKEDGMLLKQFRDMQTAAVFALKCGIVEGEAAKKTADALVANIAAHGGCIQTGFLGTSFIMDALTNGAGRPEAAYGLLLQHDNPSWLYSVDQGATTIWERWDSYTKARGFGPAYMNSFNHYAYGAVLAWMYSDAAGIQTPASGSGYSKFVLAPKPDRRLGHVAATYDTLNGRICSAWNYNADGSWTWRFTIPANTEATVAVPGAAPRMYAAGSYSVTVAK